jgi:hypothetical protein
MEEKTIESIFYWNFSEFSRKISIIPIHINKNILDFFSSVNYQMASQVNILNLKIIINIYIYI